MKDKNIYEVKEPLKIFHPIGGERVIAALFQVKDGIYFFDIGWPEATLNPLHFVAGQISGEGPWKIDDCEINLLEKDDPLMNEYLEWLDYKKENNITDEMTRKVFEENINAG